MEGITKKCYNCKKLPIEDLGDNGKGGCFTNCLPCRLRGRAENARSRLRAAGAKLGAPTSTEQPSEASASAAAPAEVLDAAPVAEGLLNRTMLCEDNKNLFVRNLFEYLGEKLPDFKIEFEQPQEGYCFTMSFNKKNRALSEIWLHLGEHQTSG